MPYMLVRHKVETTKSGSRFSTIIKLPERRVAVKEVCSSATLTIPTKPSSFWSGPILRTRAGLRNLKTCGRRCSELGLLRSPTSTF